MECLDDDHTTNGGGKNKFRVEDCACTCLVSLLLPVVLGFNTLN